MTDYGCLEAVDRMQKHIALNLDRPISLADLADAAGYSPWHSARLFKEYLGKTPFEYIRLLRLTESAKLLGNSKTKVVDVAFDFLFGSHEGFTKAFTKAFGLPPAQYRKEMPPIPLFFPSSPLSYHDLIQKGVLEMNENAVTKTIFVQVVDRPKRQLILRRGIVADEYFAYCEEVGCDIWGVLTSVKEALYEPIGLWLPPKLIRPGTSEYVQGVEVGMDYHKTLPEGFEIITLEACKMMVFQGEPYNDDDFMTEVMAAKVAIDHYNPALFGYCYDEENHPRFQLSPMGYRGYIEAIPVRSIQK